MNKFVKCFFATRPWCFVLSMSAAILGSCLSYKDAGSFSILIFLLQSICLMAVMAIANILNTYMDYQQGVDGPTCDDRTLVDNILQPVDVLRTFDVAVAISFLSFLLLAWFSPSPFLHLLALYLSGVLLSLLYSVRLKRIALGDLSVFLTNGPISLLFAYYSQGGPATSLPVVLLFSIPTGLDATAVLHTNNTRDIDTDTESKVITVANLIGKTASYFYFLLLIFSPIILFAFLTLKRSLWFLIPLLSIKFVLDCERRFRANSFKHLVEEIAFMTIKQALLFVLACYLQ